MKLKELYEATPKSRKGTLKDRNNEETAKLVELIKRVCPRNFEAVVTGKALPLYRGTGEGGHSSAFGVEYLLSPGRKEPRVSLTGSNLVMDFTRFSPAWKNVPPRNLSSSSTTNARTAELFGDAAHIIIPADSVTVFAMCPEDFNDITIGDAGIDLLTFMGEVKNFLAKVKTLSNELRHEKAEWYTDELREIMSDVGAGVKISKTSITKNDFMMLSDFIAMCVDYVNKFPETHEDGYYDNFIFAVQELGNYLEGRTLLAFFQEFVAPETMGVEVFDSYQELRAFGKEPEIWFQGPYLAIKPDDNSLSSIDELPEVLVKLLPMVKA